jgi:hypothetical protein
MTCSREACSRKAVKTMVRVRPALPLLRPAPLSGAPWDGGRWTLAYFLRGVTLAPGPPHLCPCIRRARPEAAPLRILILRFLGAGAGRGAASRGVGLRAPSVQGPAGPGQSLTPGPSHRPAGRGEKGISPPRHSEPIMNLIQPLFTLGQLVITPGAITVLDAHGVSPSDLLDRHVNGDWSEMTPEDRESNRRAVLNGGRVFSSYSLTSTVRVWVITEAKDDNGVRVSTCILLPSEY